MPSETVIDILNDLFTAFMLEIDIDIGGLVAGIEKIGTVLKAHFPRGGKDRNELPNEIDED